MVGLIAQLAPHVGECVRCVSCVELWDHWVCKEEGNRFLMSSLYHMFFFMNKVFMCVYVCVCVCFEMKGDGRFHYSVGGLTAAVQQVLRV